MKIDELMSYDEVVTSLNKKGRDKHLLLGNGFSMAYDAEIFSYNALSTFIEESEDKLLIKLFETIKTKNFELIMQQLDTFADLADAFDISPEFIDRIKSASIILRRNLIEAVKQLHPEHVFQVPEEKSVSCYRFLSEYLSKGGQIFSTNYDLLLYWVLMRNGQEFYSDGFGRDLENPDEVAAGEDQLWSELKWGRNLHSQNVFHLHGTLSIFDAGSEVIKEEYDHNYLLERIEKRMDNHDYPIFVTAGNAEEKLNHIMHNKYLGYCYEQLCQTTGSIVTLGFGFGEYDSHIIDALNRASVFKKEKGTKLLSVYIGVFSQASLERLLSMKSKFRFNVRYYNAKTCKVWT